MEVVSQCPKCGFKSELIQMVCPRCRQPLQHTTCMQCGRCPSGEKQQEKDCCGETKKA